MILTILWIIQIFITILTPSLDQIISSPYVIILQTLHSILPLLSYLFYYIIHIYLLVCILHGRYILSTITPLPYLSFPSSLTHHLFFPFKYLYLSFYSLIIHGTSIESLLHYTSIVLLVTYPLLHFSITTLSDYTYPSDLYQLLSNQISFLPFYSIFYTSNVDYHISSSPYSPSIFLFLIFLLIFIFISCITIFLFKAYLLPFSNPLSILISKNYYYYNYFISLFILILLLSSLL